MTRSRPCRRSAAGARSWPGRWPAWMPCTPTSAPWSAGGRAPTRSSRRWRSTTTVDELPAALASAAGQQRFVRIGEELDAQRAGFDPADWLGDNRGWLARAMVGGEIDAVRMWMAMATQVSWLCAALPDFVGETTCPDRSGHVADVKSIFQAPTKVANPMAERLAERAAPAAGGVGQLPAATQRRRAARPARRRRRGGRAAHPRGRDRRPDGRAGRPDRARADQGAGTPSGRRAQGGEDPLRGRDAGLRPLAAHGVRRQPRHRQDHRRPAARPHLRAARGAVQRAPGRGDPRRPGRRVHRPDRTADGGQVQPGHRRGAVHRRGVLADPARLRHATSATRPSPPC